MTRPTSPASTLTAEQRTALALQRIDASRTQLILTLSPTGRRRPAPPTSQGTGTSAGKPPQAAAFAGSLAEHMAQDGVGKGAWQAVSGAATDWLRSQPWYSSVELVGSTLVHQARPVVTRHPWLCLGAAAATGAALVALRPWGWQPVQHRMAPWRSQIGSLIWGQLTQAPVQMALAGALAAWLSGTNTTPPASDTINKKARPCPPPAPETHASSPETTAASDPHAPAAAATSRERPASSPGVMPAAPIEAP